MEHEVPFGQHVKELRRKLRLTQDELARRVSCAVITLRKIEAGELRPSQQIAERLAMALELPLDARAPFIRQARAVRPGGALPPSETPAPALDEIGIEDLSGRAIRGYQLGERIGAGGFGVVYRATQPLVEREVAIKIVLPQYANHPDFIRRFELEAQLVARLEHPHIVPLYDYWREPGIAYLVMRLLRGGSLYARLRQEALPLGTVVHLLEQVTAALHIAHRAGVIHRDLKPANILLDDDGNAYLADFGIAKHLINPDFEDQTMAGAIIGSPAYLAPEQIRAEPVSPQTDIYSLGIMLYELLAGQKPFRGPTPASLIQQHLATPLPRLTDSQPALPAALDGVIARATAKKPAERYPDALALLKAFRAAVGATLPAMAPAGSALDPTPYATVVLDLPDLYNPYKGLRAFAESDASDFFGRETLIQQLLARMAGPAELGRFLAVIGPSGSGKSSVVKAGLIPALRCGGLPGSEHWFIVEILPGAHPLEELEEALLRIATNPPDSLRAQLADGERGLLRAVRRVLPPDPAIELVLVIDQFEELFTLTTSEAERTQLLNSLVAATLDSRSRLRVVVTLRADFVDRPLQYVDFGDLLRQRAEFILPLSTDDLERAIVEPAARAGLALEPGLVEQIVHDVADQPGGLPLLQFALSELFARREGRTLTMAAYRAVGGIAGALSSRADELYAQLSPDEHEAARQLFLRLITLGEGAEDTRRRVRLDELAEDRGGADRVTSPTARVLKLYGHHRLLTFDRDPITRGQTVELAHEALIRSWGRLHQWLTVGREHLTIQRRLATAAAEWVTADHDSSFLAIGARLEQFAALRDSDLALNIIERDYLAASVERHAEEVAATEAARERELVQAQALASEQRRLAEAERLRADDQVRASARLRRRALLLSLTTLLAVVTAGVAGLLGWRARASEQLASSRELAAMALSNLSVDPERSTLLALQALTVASTMEAEDALHQALQSMRVERTITATNSSGAIGTFSPDGARIAISSQDDVVSIHDATTTAELLSIRHSPFIYSIAFSPDGRLLATAGEDKKVRIWNVATGAEMTTLNGHRGSVFCVTWSKDGSHLVTASADGTARIWNVDDGMEEQVVRAEDGMLHQAVFGYDDTRIAAVGQNQAFWIWDAASGELLQTVRGHDIWLTSITFSPDGRHIVTASEDATARIWDVETGQELVQLVGHVGVIWGVEYSPDGQWVATAGNDGKVRLWNARNGRELMMLAGHTTAVLSVSFSPDGRRLISGSKDGTIKIWDVTPEGNRDLLTLAGNSDEVTEVVFSPDGSQIATASLDGTVNVWNAQSGQQQRTVFPYTPWPRDIAFSPDGARLATATDEGMVWDVGTGTVLAVMRGHQRFLTAVAFSPDGERVATASRDGTARVWEAVSGRLLFSMADQDEGTQDIAYRPDGGQLATVGDDGTARLYDGATGKLEQAITVNSRLLAVVYSPDSRLVAFGGENGATVVDVGSGATLFTLSGHTGPVTALAFSTDGTRIATGSSDTTAKVWDSANGALLLTLRGHSGSINGVAFSPDGQRLATASADGTTRLYALSLHELVEIAQRRTTRTLTAAECREFLRQERCPEQPPVISASAPPTAATVAEAGVPLVSAVTPILHLADPAGDDNGPGTYSYPLDLAFDKQIYDLKTFEVGYDNTSLVFTFTLNGPIVDTWAAPNHLSLHTLDVYVDTDPGAGTGQRMLLPGRGAALAPGTGWEYAIWAEGWYPTVIAGKDDRMLRTTTPVDVMVDAAASQVVIRVPRAAFGPGDPRRWGYAAAVLSQDAFGLARIRNGERSASQWTFGGVGLDMANYTRILDIADTGDQVEQLSAEPRKGPVEGLTPDDFAQLRLLSPEP